MAAGITEQDRRLHILNVNVNGLKTKGDKLLHELGEFKKSKEGEVDVLFLTKTKLGPSDTWEKYNDWEPHFTSFGPNSKGVAILLNKKRGFSESKGFVDEKGHYVIVTCKISGRSCTFVCVYHHKTAEFLEDLSKRIKPTDILVVGGRFITALDKVKDRMSESDNKFHNKVRKELLPFMKDHDLIDAWRELYPDEEHFTYEYTKKYTHEKLKSRLDYFFINADKLELVTCYKINSNDLKSVSLILCFKVLKIFSSTMHDLPSDEVLAELCPDIVLLAERKAKKEDYITKLKEREENWNVFESRQSNAAILVTKRQRGIEIVEPFHEHCVILHCRVFGMRHTFVSVCHPSRSNLQDVSQEIMSNRSGRIVIGGDFNTSDQTIMEFMTANNFNKLEREAMQPYLVHATLEGAFKIITKRLARPYFLLILHLPQENVDITREMSNLILKQKEKNN